MSCHARKTEEDQANRRQLMSRSVCRASRREGGPGLSGGPDVRRQSPEMQESRWYLYADIGAGSNLRDDGRWRWF